MSTADDYRRLFSALATAAASQDVQRREETIAGLEEDLATVKTLLNRLTAKGTLDTSTQERISARITHLAGLISTHRKQLKGLERL